MKTLPFAALLLAPTLSHATPIFWDEASYGNVDGHVFTADAGINVVRGTACILRGTLEGCGTQNNSVDPFNVIIASGQRLVAASWQLLDYFDARNAIPYVFQGNLWDAAGNFSAVERLWPNGAGTFSNIVIDSGLFAASSGTTFAFFDPAVLTYAWEFTFNVTDTSCIPFPGGGATHGCFPGGGNALAANHPVSVPEPTTLSLLGLGILALAFLRRMVAR